MPAYHSTWNEDVDSRVIGNMIVLPFATKVRGPVGGGSGAGSWSEDPDQPDIISEALNLFRANALFRNFEIQGPADRVLIYLILFIGDCLTKIGSSKAPGWTHAEAVKQLTSHAMENFALPGEPGFPLNSVYSSVGANRNDADALRAYLTQARQEMALRLLDKVYEGGKSVGPSKWWMCFQKRKFMGKSLSN